MTANSGIQVTKNDAVQSLGDRAAEKFQQFDEDVWCFVVQGPFDGQKALVRGTRDVDNDCY